MPLKQLSNMPFLLPIIDNVTQFGVIFANFSTLD